MAKKLYLNGNCERVVSLEPLLAFKLIPLDKKIGVKPIWIGEMIRRIIGCAVIIKLPKNILESAGDLQLWAGHCSGCEVALQTLSSICNEENFDATKT